MEAITTLDLEDLTPRQLRKLLQGVARNSLPHHKKSDDEKESDKEKAADDNDSLVDLDRKKGDSKPPKVNADDLPADLKEDEDEGKEEKKDKKPEEKEDD